MPDTYHMAGSGGDRHLNFYGDRDNLMTGQIRCSGCGKWIRERPEAGDWDEAERAYQGDEYEEHYCEADFGHALDLTSEDEYEAWKAFERREVLREVHEVSVVE